MYLVQVLLPTRDNHGAAFPQATYDAVRGELTDRFGGVTAYLRSPAAGVWKDDDGDVTREDIVIVETMAEQLDREWWRDYRRGLERRFRQDEVVIRATSFEPL